MNLTYFAHGNNLFCPGKQVCCVPCIMCLCQCRCCHQSVEAAGFSCFGLIDGHAHAFLNAVVVREITRIIGSGNGGFARFIGS